MSEIVEIQVICDFEPVTIQVFEAGDIPGVTVHEQLTGRDADDQHPISAITDLQTALDSKALKQIQFFPTEQTEAFTITGSMLYKLVYINSATDVEVTVADMGVGSAVRFHLLGAGLPVFVEGGNQSITGIDEDGKPLGTDRKDVLIERFEDIAGVEIYNVI